jgi:hypothetical protein
MRGAALKSVRHRVFSRAIAVALALGFAFISPAAHAQDAGALLDLLVKKRIITDQEAEEVRGELTREASTTAAGKLKLSDPLQQLEIYGDARTRYEIRNGNSGPPSALVTNPNDAQQRNRHRYRLRLGIRGQLMDDWFFGLRLETSTSNRSTNVTGGDDAGPFGKTNDGAFVGQAYLAYKGIRDLTITVGRQPNPFVTTPMVWDGDINPEGFSQQWKHTYNLSLGGGDVLSAETGDGKNTVAAVTSEPRKMTIDVFANFGQFVYDDNNPENPLGAPAVLGGRRVPENDAYMFGHQIGAKFNFTPTTWFQLAPTIYHYSGYGNDFNTLYSGGPNFRTGAPPVTVTPNQVGINSLLIFNMPASFGFNIGELPARIFSDFAVNLDAEDRALAAGRSDKDDQRYAYQIGVGIGRIRTKGNWEINAFYQHAEQFALDSNLVDSDIFDSRVNMEGFAVQGGYALSDAVTFNLTYAFGEQIDNTLGTGGVGDIGVNPLRQYQIFQADLNFKF